MTSAVHQLQPRAANALANEIAARRGPDLDRFKQMMTEWRRLTDKAASIEAETGKEEAELTATIGARDELARKITATPTREVVNMLAKLEVLEHTARDAIQTGSYSDCREIMMIGSIRADLLAMSKEVAHWHELTT